MRSRASLEQELAQLIRARTDWLRWYGQLHRGYLERTARRMEEIKAQLKETDEQQRR